MPVKFEDILRWTSQEASERLSSSDEEIAEIMKVAADGGLADAQALYGQMLLDGKGVARNPAEALRRFSDAAHAGHVMAMNMVGRCCEHGWGTRVDAALAAKWYEVAAERGLDWGMYNLATLHCLGRGVALDHQKAHDLFARAAGLGHVKSLNMLGGFHEDGWVVAQDMKAAAALYHRAAEGGDFRGMFNHARMLIDAGDIDGATAWLNKLPACATADFMEKVRNWLENRTEPALKALAFNL